MRAALDLEIRPPESGAGGEPLYKKLVANFDAVTELKSILVKGGTRGHCCEASVNLDEHFEFLRQDFVGLPLLCFAHAQLVVCIRRSLGLSENLPVFLKLWATESEFLTAHLNSRWLISACDTFADHGSDAQRAAAMLLVVLINTVKLAETDRLSLCDATSLPEKFDAIVESHRAKTHIELWDGITAYSPVSGDMPRNMFRRLAALTGKDPALAAIAKTLIRRAIKADTVLGRLAKLNSGFLPVGFA